MSDPRVNRRVVASESADLRMSLDQMDMASLRRGFAALIDRLADQIFATGSDFDEVEVERIILVAAGAKEVEIVAEYLSDEGLLRKSMGRQLCELGGAELLGDLSIKELRVRALSDRPA